MSYMTSMTSYFPYSITDALRRTGTTYGRSSEESLWSLSLIQTSCFSLLPCLANGYQSLYSDAAVML